MSESERKRTWRISRRLKQARGAAVPKLSQSELARRVQLTGLKDFPPGLASRLELGYSYATWPQVEAVAAVLGVTPQWLAEVDEPAENAAKPATPPPEKPVAPPPPPPGMAKSQSTPPPALLSATVPAPPPPPPPPALVLTVPPREGRSLLDYRSLLVAERTKAEQTMAQKGIRPADWRQWRDYAREVNELIRTLQD